MANAVCVLANQQSPVPGQISGAVGTAFYNNCKMLQIADHMLTRKLKFTEDQALSPDFLKVCEKLGVVMKLELVTPDILDREGSWELIPMDFLGSGS